MATPFRVAVLGPADPTNDEGRAKRGEILQSLIDIGMKAFLPEIHVVDSPAVSDTDQERIILRNPNVDFIVALDTSVGVLGELASFQNDLEIVRKCFVMYPAENYNPVTYTADVVWQYWMRIKYPHEEFEQCELVSECVSRAKALRRAKHQESPARQF